MNLFLFSALVFKKKIFLFLSKKNACILIKYFTFPNRTINQMEFFVKFKRITIDDSIKIFSNFFLIKNLTKNVFF